MAKKAPKKAAKKGAKKAGKDGQPAPEFLEQEQLPGVRGPGVERIEVKELDAAYRKYKPVEDTRLESARKAKDLRATLIQKMHENIASLPRDEANNPFYITTDDKRITLETKGEKLVILDEEIGD
jgi:hypothetical protein